MRRVVVAGAFGVFGAAAVERLRDAGVEPVLASRRASAPLRLDVDDPASLRAGLRPGDVVLDAAGPFQPRTAALVEAACAIRFDVIDLADCVAHVERVRACQSRIDAAGIAVLSACSTVSAISAAILGRSGVDAPVRLTTLLAPALHHTARPGTAASLLLSLGAPVRVRRDGALTTCAGWSESRRFDWPPPVGHVAGRLFETADALLLPEVWPSLRTVELFVHLGVPGLAAALAVAARAPFVRGLLRRSARAALAVTRLIGPRAGWVAYEVAPPAGPARRFLVAGGGPRGHHAAVVPAVLAARALAGGRFPHRGLVRADRQADPDALFAALAALGITRAALPPTDAG